MAKYVVLVLFLVLKFFTLDNCFFWDNVAGYSMPGQLFTGTRPFLFCLSG